MTPRDLSEIKRRLDPNKRYPGAVRGCYVNDDGEVLCTFEKPLAMMTQEEADRYMAIFRRILTGTQGQNLLPVCFPGAATVEDEAFNRLYALRQSRLSDEERVLQLYGEIMAWLAEEKNARPQSADAGKNMNCSLILLLADAFDEYHRRRDGEEDRERSDTMYTYFLCAVCPVKLRKPELAWQAGDFGVTADDWVVAAPEMGFLYPAREQGASDIYAALYYTKSTAEAHDGFVAHVFGAETEMPAARQTEALCAMLQESLQEECSLEVLQAVHETVSDMIREQKADKQADPLNLGSPDICRLLKDCGVSEEKTEAFAEEYEEVFGRNTGVPAVNLVNPRAFRLATPSVSIRVDPAHADLVSTRIIDGQRCIVILADGAVEVNGVNVAIAE